MTLVAAYGRERIEPAGAQECRDVWAEIEVLWSGTIDGAVQLPPDLLHVRVDGEWSFIETLRHLLFVVDAWGNRALGGVASPYDPLDLPPSGMRNSAVPCDVTARPALRDVLALRAERMVVVRRIMDELTDEALGDATVRVRGRGYPRPGSYPVRTCVQALLNEHWHHRAYAERDLAKIRARG
jgi:hypothetical protein